MIQLIWKLWLIKCCAVDEADQLTILIVCTIAHKGWTFKTLSKVLFCCGLCRKEARTLDCGNLMDMLFCQLLHCNGYMFSMIAINRILALCKTFVVDHARNFLAAGFLCRISCLSRCTIFKRWKYGEWQRVYISLDRVAIPIFWDRKRWICIEGIPRCSRCWRLYRC